jgi:polar amino acid transport system substrate-binding protein
LATNQAALYRIRMSRLSTKENSMKKLIVLFALLAAVLPGLALSQPLEVMTEELPPFNFTQNGAIEGITADTLLYILEKAGNPIDRSTIKVMPWPRAYEAVQQKPGTVLFSMARTEQRENMFKWVGPIYEAKIGLIGAKSKNIKIESAADLNNYRIGTIREGAPEQLLVSAGGDITKFDRDTRPELQVKKLNADRIDLFSFNLPTAQYLMKAEGMNPGDYDTVYTLKVAQLHIAFHKDTDDALIAKLQKALEEMKTPDADGMSKFDRVVEKYLGSK